MMYHAAKFLGEYIDAEIPPPLSGNEPDTKLLSESHPVDNGDIIAANADIDEIAADLGNDLELKRAIENRIQQYKNRLKEFMGEYQVLKTSSGDFKWKSYLSKSECNYKNCFEALLAYATLCPDPALIRAEAERLKALYTTEKPRERKFYTPFRSEKA